jgi:hypothetical protein
MPPAHAGAYHPRPEVAADAERRFILHRRCMRDAFPRGRAGRDASMMKRWLITRWCRLLLPPGSVGTCRCLRADSDLADATTGDMEIFAAPSRTAPRRVVDGEECEHMLALHHAAFNLRAGEGWQRALTKAADCGLAASAS